jgi:signal transduction histidine kinase
VIGSAFAVHELLGYPGSAATLALFVASYSAGAHQRRHRTAVIALAAAGCGLTSVLLVRAGSPTPAVGFLAASGFLAACWAAGAWTRARQQNAELRRRSSVEAALAAERARIARELHDVVTHHVTAMVVQADAAQFVVGDAPVATGLAAISDTGRLALADLRHLLGVLGPDGNAQPAGSAERTPAVGPIRELVEQARRNGQPVELIEDGESPARPGGAELAAYRVVQEALTNALKHAPGRATTVRVRHANREAEIEILTQGPGGAADRAGDQAGGPVGDRAGARSDPRSDRREFSGSGRGLTGMRERVAVFGGELAAGPTSDGGFQVKARIPRGDA